MVNVAGVAIKLVTNMSAFSIRTVVFVAVRAKFVVVANGGLVSFVAFKIFVET
jgi:hypothetical protein